MKFHLLISYLCYFCTASDESGIRTGHEWKFKASLSGDDLYEPVESDYIATVKIVDFAKCQKQVSKTDFYKGMIMNFHYYELWTYYPMPPPHPPSTSQKQYDMYNIADIKHSGSTLSRYAITKPKTRGGMDIEPKAVQEINTHGWAHLEWGYDIRRQNFTFELDTFCGAPQMYIPLIHWEDSSLRDKKGFMLHIYPDAKLMPGVPGPVYQKSIQWYRNSWSRDSLVRANSCGGRVTFKIDLFEVFSNMKSYYMSDLQKGIKGTYSNQKPSTTSVLKTQVLVGPSKGSAGEELCSTIKAESLLDFRTFLGILKEVISWLV